MAILTQASRQWASRPADERFTSLLEMRNKFQLQRARSRGAIVSSRHVTAITADENDPRAGLMIQGTSGIAYAPTHWAFGQVAALAGAPAGYLRGLPAPLAADCVNYGMKHSRDIAEVGLLLEAPPPGDSDRFLRAATGPQYGRIWNAEITHTLVNRFGDGVSGDWRVPGEFGVALGEVSKANTTLFAGDRDMFVFLADEINRIEIPNRRNGQSGSLARGFFVWNSEVGSSTFGLGTFLFDYACCNRIVWGAEEYKEIRIRHTKGGPDRFVEQLMPALEAYSEGSSRNIVNAIEAARAARIDGLDDFLAKRQFSKSMSRDLSRVHLAEEGRPIETLWDVTTAATALARDIPYQNERVELERRAGDIMAMAT